MKKTIGFLHPKEMPKHFFAMNNKGQSTIIGFILITAIAIVIVAFALFFSTPLLERSADQLEVRRLEQKFIELHDTIKKVASDQGQLSTRFVIKKGFLSLDPEDNDVVFESQLNLNAPIPCKVIFGFLGRCDKIQEVGESGIDESAILTEQSAVDFRLHYRILNNTAGDCFRIKLVPGQQTAASSGRHTIFVKWLQENTTTNVTSVPTFTSGCNTSEPLTEQIVEFNIA